MSPAKAAGPLLQRHSLNILRCKSLQAPVVNMNYLYQAFNNTLVDWFKPPSMDLTFPGDLHNCFKLFKQKCELIFVGSLDKVQKANKARLLWLWIDDESLEIYNTSTWTNEGDDLMIVPVMVALEAYTKPQGYQILARYQLRCLKQGDRPLEKFEGQLLVEDGGIDPNAKEKVHWYSVWLLIKIAKTPIVLGNGLSFKLVYDLAKVDESTKAQMKIISKGDEKFDVHAVQRASGYSTRKRRDQNKIYSTGRKPLRFQFQSKG